jgi:hypothetical protein
MTAVTLPTRSSPPWRDAAAFAWKAWISVPRRRWAWVLAVGTVVTLIGLPQRVDLIQKAGWHPLPAVADTLLPLLASLIMFLGWVLADAASDAWRDRRTRLLYALLASAAAATLACVFLWYQSGAGDLWAQVAAQRGKAPKSVGLMLLADYINMVVVGGMIYAVAELLCQRARTQRDFEATVRQQVSLEHQVLESRLSAMQAQVEPRFLFDTLVDIEALYARDPQRAADNLDRLITYLRAALPRLRETGSTIDAELDLVRAYLEVVNALHEGRPRLTIAAAEACRQSRFYPMLLLPLVQRAVRHPSGLLTEDIAIDVRRDRGELVVELRIALPGGCADDPELARVRERLAGLYGAAARLDCTEIAGAATVLTLRFPADGAAAAR